MEANPGRFSLRPRVEELPRYAGLYDAPSDDPVLPFLAGGPCRELSKEEFLVLVRWKSPRALSRARRNEEGFVRAVTRASFGSSNEQLRIQALLMLRGVGWPTASVLLHLCLKENYPILDFRALWTLGMEKPPNYDFDFWRAYVDFFRGLKEESGLSARDLDRALWQYSKEHQEPN